MSKRKVLSDYQYFLERCSETWSGKYEYIRYDWDCRKVLFKNVKTGKEYYQNLYEHIKGSVTYEEIKDNSFFKLLEIADTENFIYTDFVDTNTPITVTDISTGNVYKQLYKDIIAGHKPQALNVKYTSENIQSYSNLIHNSRFEVISFSGILSDIIVKCRLTDKEFTQKAFNHIAGNLPKELSYGNSSRKEAEVIDKLLQINPNFNIEKSYKPSWLLGKEIDVFIHDLNIGIEVNGTAFHHSTQNPSREFLKRTYKTPTYHLDKCNICLKNNVNLIHIFDFDVLDIEGLLKDYSNPIHCFKNEWFYVSLTKNLITNDENDLVVYKPKPIFKNSLPS